VLSSTSVGNPYCTGVADIDYANQQDLYSNGGYYVYGAHDKMPDHEFYRQDFYSDGTNTVRRVFHHKLDRPSCLAGALAFCGSKQYQYVA
jgi:hypothetical protein